MSSMSDFEHLSSQHKALLNIKMDGYIEASVAAARRLNLGVSEALLLCLLATLREFRAYGMGCDRAIQMWDQAVAMGYPAPISAQSRVIN